MSKDLKNGVRLGVGFALLLATLSTVAYLRIAAMQSSVVDVVEDKFPRASVPTSLPAWARSMASS